MRLILTLCVARSSLFWVSSFMSLWSNILFNCAVIINLIVAFFYPFDNGGSSSSSSNVDDGQRRRMISGKSSFYLIKNQQCWIIIRIICNLLSCHDKAIKPIGYKSKVISTRLNRLLTWYIIMWTKVKNQEFKMSLRVCPRTVCFLSLAYTQHGQNAFTQNPFFYVFK